MTEGGGRGQSRWLARVNRSFAAGPEERAQLLHLPGYANRWALLDSDALAMTEGGSEMRVLCADRRRIHLPGVRRLAVDRPGA
ncbi:MAG TPA: hypothetical protein ENK50_09925 [Sedimenticola sp.]|nr:hypothetical protein [Sedimenticola sp.]